MVNPYILILATVNFGALMLFMGATSVGDNIPRWYLWIAGPIFIYVANILLFDGESRLVERGKLALLSFPLSFLAVVIPFMAAIFVWVLLQVVWQTTVAFV